MFSSVKAIEKKEGREDKEDRVGKEYYELVLTFSTFLL